MRGTQSEIPKMVHIWMADGRSLCDLRAPGRIRKHAELSDAEFSDYLGEQVSAPACGACIVVASHIRQEAAYLIAEAESGLREIYPKSAVEAYGLLDSGRWGEMFKPEPPDELSAERFYRITIVDHFTQGWMDEAASERAAQRDQWRETAVAERAEWRESNATETTEP